MRSAGAFSLQQSMKMNRYEPKSRKPASKICETMMRRVEPVSSIARPTASPVTRMISSERRKDCSRMSSTGSVRSSLRRASLLMLPRSTNHGVSTTERNETAGTTTEMVPNSRSSDDSSQLPRVTL